MHCMMQACLQTLVSREEPLPALCTATDITSVLTDEVGSSPSDLESIARNVELVSRHLEANSTVPGRHRPR